MRFSERTLRRPASRIPSDHGSAKEPKQRQRVLGRGPRKATGENRGPAPGSRLAEAFEAVERFPVLVESRERVMRAATAETSRVGEIVETVEADVALTISVLRFANRGAGPLAASPTFPTRSTC